MDSVVPVAAELIAVARLVGFGVDFGVNLQAGCAGAIGSSLAGF